MDFSILVPTLARYGAPMIAELFETAATDMGGPLAGMAVTGISNFVLSRLAQAFGTGEDPAVLGPAIETAAQADPVATQAKLQQVQSDHEALIKQAMAQAAIDEQNVESARATEVQRALHGSLIERLAPLILAAVIVIGFFGTVLTVLLLRLNTSDPIIVYALTTQGAAFLALVGYYFGSSLGSKSKTDMIASGLPPATKQAVRR